MLLLAAGSAAAESALDSAARALREALRSGDRAGLRSAIERLRVTDEPRAIDLLVEASGGLSAERDRIDARRRKDQGDLEATAAALEKEMRRFEKMPAPSSIDLARHQERRIELDGRYRSLGHAILEAGTDIERVRVDLDAVRVAVTAVLGRLGEAQVGPTIERLAAAWLTGPAADPEDRLRYVDAIERVPGTRTAAALRQVTLDARLDPRARVAALAGRADRHDESTMADAVALLDDPTWCVQAGAIDALRVLHERGGIEPLIGFLGRTGIGRLREDACRALRSLTGEEHGPYQQPWAAWWHDEKAVFEMPRRPAALRALLAPPEGLTFYGITTFSRRVVFVLDVSASMAETTPVPGKRPPEAKIEAARRELAAAVDMLEDGSRLGILVFEEGVRSFEPSLVTVDRSTRARAIAWAKAQPPHGPTNIHGALEAAFLLAAGGTSARPPAVGADTIFFLTDGQPTAGAVRDRDALIAAVRRWHRATRVVVHCVGLGAHDADLLRGIANMTSGKYVAR